MYTPRSILDNKMTNDSLYSKIMHLAQSKSENKRNSQSSPNYILKYIKNISKKQGKKIKQAKQGKKSTSFQTVMDSKKLNVHQNLLKQKPQIRRIRMNVNSQQCLVIQPNYKERSSNNIKSFMKTIHAINDISSFQSIDRKRYPKREIKKQQKPHQNRWKNMIQKSNRKKKQLQQLFKTRPLFGKKQLERRVGESKLGDLLGMNNKMGHFERLIKDQFDDKSLYCPWTYKQQRLVNHLKAKQII